MVVLDSQLSAKMWAISQLLIKILVISQLSVNFDRCQFIFLMKIPKEFRVLPISLRVTVRDDDTIEEVDLSQKYFSFQMKALLNKGTKSIKLRLFEFDSPAVMLVLLLTEYKTWLKQQQTSASRFQNDRMLEDH